jgi:hypothetical protein
MIEILILFLLFTKHFVVDFPLQTPFQWMNKGTYGHPGGLLHAALHGWFTYAALLFFVSWPWAVVLGIVDMVIHYHIDWAKVNLNRVKGWKADKDPQFWTALGADQYAHALTYLGIAAVASFLM